MKKQVTAQAALVALALAPGQGHALGFGRVISDTVLGQPLSFTVPVRVDPGERFGEDCVHPLVFFGDAQLPPNQVLTSVERGASDTEWRVRIATTGPVNEPVVDVSLEAGCSRPFARKFTVFADPPSVPWTSQLAQAEATPAEPPVAASRAPSAGSPHGTAATPEISRATVGRGPAGPRPVIRKGPTVALANAVAARAAAPRRRSGAAVSAAAPNGGAPAPTPRLQAVESAARLELSAGFGGPRLRMDIDDPVIPPADATAAAALTQQVEGDTQQLENLQRNIAGLRVESRTGHAQTARLRAALEDSESRSQWLPWLAGLFGLTLAAALVLAWRLRQQSRLAHRSWYEESELLAASATPAPKPAPAAPATPVSLAPAAPAALPEAAAFLRAEPVEVVASTPLGAAESGGAVVQDMTRTAPVDVAAVAQAKAMASIAPLPLAVAPVAEHEVSVEELLDIEQQADFFVALGQEDAAIDLLTAHIRSTGVHSPLPYAKLLELHRRLDDGEAYERVRERFERRFGVVAPDWATGPTAGLALDGYPEAITRLQIVWKAPADAMVLLESLLFKRDPADPMLDLPAYRDVVLLYSVARDMVQHPPRRSAEGVDVFLPIGDVASALAAAAADSVRAGRDELQDRDAAVAPTSFEMPDLMAAEPPSDFGEVHATLELSPLDFDISEPAEGAGAVVRDADESGGPRHRR
jgi:hypothetical protein